MIFTWANSGCLWWFGLSCSCPYLFMHKTISWGCKSSIYLSRLTYPAAFLERPPWMASRTQKRNDPCKNVKFKHLLFNFNRDPHWVPQSMCKNNDTRGCFYLSHDDPTPSLNCDSLFDVLTFIGQDPLTFKNVFLSFFLRFLNHQPTKTFAIALCFKDAPQKCQNTTLANGWVSLVDEFFQKANALISKNNLNLEFILDGDATPNGKL